MVGEPVPSSVANLPSSAIHSVEMVSMAFILKGHVSALESTLLSSSRCIGELELKGPVNNSEFDGDAAELGSTERFLRFAENANRLMWEKGRNQSPDLNKMESAPVATKVAEMAVESIVPLLTAPNSALRGKAV